MLLLFLFEDKIIGIGLWLITQLFKVAAGAFKVFMLLAQNDVLSEIDYSRLLTNFYVIIGITMLFIMAFALLRGIVNPDDQKQGTTAVKNIIINFVLSCIMLGFLPTVFPFMFDLQDAILRYNVIGGFFGYGQVGKPLTDNSNVNDVESGAYRLTNGVFTAFFNVSEGYCNETLKGQTFATKAEEITTCQQKLEADDDNELIADGDNDHNGKTDFLSFKEHVDETGDFSVYSGFIGAAADNNVNFNFIVLLIAGCALLYVGVSYCFDMGLRLIKLIFYQVLAPIPIFLRVIPNSKFSGTFNQWLKVTLTCWMEVFVRIFIFSFCMWLCKAIMSTDFLSSNVYEYGKLTGLFTQAFILMAIVMFMKRSPKLLSEITGIDSGDMKLGLKDKFKEVTSGVSAIPGVKTIGTLGKKVVSGWDAHRNGYKFSDGWKRIEGTGPYARFRKWKDNFLPYSAANMENRRKSKEQLSEIEDKKKRGKKFAENLRKDLTEAYKTGNLDLLDKVLEIKDKNGKIISAKDATPEMIQEAIGNAGAGEFIKHLAATSSNKDFKALGVTYNDRSVAKRKMLEAKAEMEAAQQSGDSARISAASKKFSEMNDSYEAIDNEWKQRLAALNNKKEIGGYNAMKYNEDRSNALPKDNSYQATRNVNNASDGNEIPPSIAGNSQPTMTQPINTANAGKDEILNRLNELQKQDLDNYRKNLDQQWRSATTKEEKDRIYKDIEEFNKRHGN